MPRVSILQLLGGHDECVASLLYSLNQCGIVADVYITNKLRLIRGDIFDALGLSHQEFLVTNDFNPSISTVPENENRIFWIQCEGPKLREILLQNRKYTSSVLFWTSYKNSNPLMRFCIDLDFFIYAFIHNSRMHRRYAELLSLPNTKAVLFSRGMEKVSNLTKKQFIKFYLPPMSSRGGPFSTMRAYQKSQEIIRIAVPGKVSYKHRDYSLLLGLARRLASKNISNIRFVIVGGVSSPDGQNFHNEIQRLKTQHLFEYPIADEGFLQPDATSFLSYSELFEILSSCDIAIENSNSVKSDNSKISGAVNLCINFGLPLIYTKGFSMYREFDHVGGSFVSEMANPQSIESIITSLTLDELTRKKSEALTLKGEMEAANYQVLTSLV